MSNETYDVRDFYIGGQWTSPSGTDRVEITDSSTGAVLGSAPCADATDVNRAVSAAGLASDEWSRVPPAERAALLSTLGDRLESRLEELAILEAREIGTPLEESRLGQVWQAADFLRALPESVSKIAWETSARNAVAVRVPVGVAGAITAWNFPLQIIAAKAGGALAAGCTVVIKSSEVAPLGSFVFAEEAGKLLPAGAINVLTGYGPVAGQALVEHPGVAKVSFTGSVETARQISLVAAPVLKPLHLELGGKSASIVLEDADLESAVQGSLANAFQGSGQVCCATTRVLVPRDQLSAAEEIAAHAIGTEWVVGPSLDETSKIGPLVSARQQQRVLGYISSGLSEGARLIAGGVDPPFERGHFVAPTVFTTDNTTRIAREEIFGPVVSLIPYDGGDADALALANDTRYGLGGAVWSTDETHAREVALRMRTGQVEVNGAPWDATAPFGGFGDSGYGRENGAWGIEEFLSWRALHL